MNQLNKIQVTKYDFNKNSFASEAVNINVLTTEKLGSREKRHLPSFTINNHKILKFKSVLIECKSYAIQ